MAASSALNFFGRGWLDGSGRARLLAAPLVIFCLCGHAAPLPRAGREQCTIGLGLVPSIRQLLGACVLIMPRGWGGWGRPRRGRSVKRVAAAPEFNVRAKIRSKKEKSPGKVRWDGYSSHYSTYNVPGRVGNAVCAKCKVVFSKSTIFKRLARGNITGSDMYTIKLFLMLDISYQNYAGKLWQAQWKQTMGNMAIHSTLPWRKKPISRKPKALPPPLEQKPPSRFPHPRPRPNPHPLLV